MNTPPFLLGATLLFWGWQTGHAAVGAVLALLIESPRVMKARWSFSQADFDRLWNICAFLFVATAAYLFFNEGTLSFNDFLVDAGRRPEAIAEKGRAALLWFQWFPMVFFPFVIAAAFSDEPEIDVTTFSWFLRRRRGDATRRITRINTAFPYFAATAFASTASNHRSPWFYPCLCLLIAWAIWSRRVRRIPAVAWVAAFAIVAAGGHFGHRSIDQVYRKLEELNATWFSRFASLTMDTRHTRTAIGSIGSIKLSKRIVLRLRTDGQPPPSVLREASFNAYRAGSWHNTNKEFGRVFEASTNATTWLLITNPAPNRHVNVAQYLRKGSGILPVPTGVAHIDSLPVVDIETNSHGVLRVKGGPGLAVYDVHYGDRATIDSTPKWDDLRSPDENEPAVEQVANELGLHPGMDPRQAMRIVSGFLSANFSYSSYLTKAHAATSNETALARFLLKERSGHCEYFATAATLLLRKAAVPTRYAVGYAVHEGSGKKWMVRERDGHAWTLVYHSGRWHDFDTTPAGWAALERKDSSWLQPLKDLGSNLWFYFSKWRWSATEWRKYVIWIPIPLVTIALASFFLKKQWRHIRRPDQERRRDWPGRDSELYAVEQALASRGLDRGTGENWSAWLARIEQYQGNAEELRPLILLHSKYRFDPEGLTEAERAQLRANARGFLQQLKRMRARAQR